MPQSLFGHLILTVAPAPKPANSKPTTSMKTACTAIIASIAACTAMAASTEDRMAQFAQWAAQHGKTYEGEEAQRRLEVFSANAEAIEEHNAKGLSWTMGLNEFSDLTNEEFTAIYTGGFKGVPRNASDVGKPNHSRRTQGQGSLPPSVDWTAAGENSIWYCDCLRLLAFGCWSWNTQFSDRPILVSRHGLPSVEFGPWRVYCDHACYGS